MQKKQQQWVNNTLQQLEFTVAEQLQLKALILKDEVSHLLQWNDFEYANFQQNCGLNYLTYITKGHCDAIDELAKNKLFWNWWMMHWTARDESYIESCIELQRLSLSKRLEVYINVHNARHLAHEIYPDGKLLAEAYKIMIGEVIKNEVK